MSRDSTSSLPRPSALVAGMAAGDDRALGALYDAYGHTAYALAFAITGAQATAESVVSQAFAEAWRSASAFNASGTSVLAWLTSIVRRTALQARGPETRASRVSSGDRVASAVSISMTSAAGHALQRLSAAQRQVLELSYYRGLTVGEIAAQLGEPESGTRELLRSAMQELRSALARGAISDEPVVTRA
jgi:RNA polymerase sigma-70 factor (ECF subfamily)